MDAAVRRPAAGETADVAAARELREETGLELTPLQVPEAAQAPEVALYVAEADAYASVVLDGEHDRFEWIAEEEAVARCLPAGVGADLTAAARWLDRRFPLS